jgi:hypothetical protein
LISLNGLIGSALVDEIMLLLASDSTALARSRPLISVYSAFQGSLVAMEPRDFLNCPTCGSDGVLGTGDLAPVRRATDLNGREVPVSAFSACSEEAGGQEIEGQVSEGVVSKEKQEATRRVFGDRFRAYLTKIRRRRSP